MERRVKVREETARLLDLTIDADLVRVVLVDHEGVEVADTVVRKRRGALEVLLLHDAGLGVLVTEDDVNLRQARDEL